MQQKILQIHVGKKNNSKEIIPLFLVADKELELS
jgi:hypothetical protein